MCSIPRALKYRCDNHLTNLNYSRNFKSNYDGAIMSQLECTCKNGNHDSCNGFSCQCPRHPNTVKVNLNKEHPMNIKDTRVSNSL